MHPHTALRLAAAALSIGLPLLSAGCTSHGQAAKTERMTSEDAPMPPPENLRVVMQSKTAWTGSLLEAVATRDYDRVVTNAEALRKLSLDAGFIAQDTLSYRTLAEEFRTEVGGLAEAARRRDQADVESSFHRVTAACFRCHAYVGSERYQSSMPGRAGM